MQYLVTTTKGSVVHKIFDDKFVAENYYHNNKENNAIMDEIESFKYNNKSYYYGYLRGNVFIITDTYAWVTNFIPREPFTLSYLEIADALDKFYKKLYASTLN